MGHRPHGRCISDRCVGRDRQPRRLRPVPAPDADRAVGRAGGCGDRCARHPGAGRASCVRPAGAAAGRAHPLGVAVRCRCGGDLGEPGAPVRSGPMAGARRFVRRRFDLRGTRSAADAAGRAARDVVGRRRLCGRPADRVGSVRSGRRIDPVPTGSHVRIGGVAGRIPGDGDRRRCRVARRASLRVALAGPGPRARRRRIDPDAVAGGVDRCRCGRGARRDLAGASGSDGASAGVADVGDRAARRRGHGARRPRDRHACGNVGRPDRGDRRWTSRARADGSRRDRRSADPRVGSRPVPRGAA